MVSNMQDTGQMNSEAISVPAEPTPPQPTSVIRTRVIPVIAGTLVVGLLALLAPESQRVDAKQTVTEFEAGVYDEPRQAPEFTLAGFDGSSFSLSDYRGQVVVLNFWASWCDPCIAEMPMLNRIADEFQDEE